MKESIIRQETITLDAEGMKEILKLGLAVKYNRDSGIATPFRVSINCDEHIEGFGVGEHPVTEVSMVAVRDIPVTAFKEVPPCEHVAFTGGRCTGCKKTHAQVEAEE